MKCMHGPRMAGYAQQMVWDMSGYRLASLAPYAWGMSGTRPRVRSLMRTDLKGKMGALDPLTGS